MLYVSLCLAGSHKSHTDDQILDEMLGRDAGSGKLEPGVYEESGTVGQTHEYPSLS